MQQLTFKKCDCESDLPHGYFFVDGEQYPLPIYSVKAGESAINTFAKIHKIMPEDLVSARTELRGAGLSETLTLEDLDVLNETISSLKVDLAQVFPGAFSTSEIPSDPVSEDAKRKLIAIADHFKWIESALTDEGFRPEGDPTERIEEYGLQFFLAKPDLLGTEVVQVTVRAKPGEPINVQVWAFNQTSGVVEQAEEVVFQRHVSEEELFGESFKKILQGTIVLARDIASNLKP